jgi:hypothetical protein
MPLGLAVMALGAMLMLGGGVAGWRRGATPAWATKVVQSRVWERVLRRCR